MHANRSEDFVGADALHGTSSHASSYLAEKKNQKRGGNIFVRLVDIRPAWPFFLGGSMDFFKGRTVITEGSF
jgi:hypothetical protein